MLTKDTNFSVFWSDLCFRIEQNSPTNKIWRDLDQKCKSTLDRIQRNILRMKGRRYDLEQPETEDDSKIILDHLNGSFNSGELVGVLGPSGAGKTSLLNFLSGRRRKGYTGRLEVQSSSKLLKISTIPQDINLPGYLTVRENLLYASRLNNDKPRHEHELDCIRTAELLGIEQCLDVATKNISGGQQKRLAIAQELLTKPDILILDEPTSGLDSLTCLNTISVLKNLVRSSQKQLLNPISIVLTIHQPPQDVFKMFDQVYVMATGGIAIYAGLPDNCSQFLVKNAGVDLPYESYNPATFAIEIASGTYGEGAIRKLQQKALQSQSTGESLWTKKMLQEPIEMQKQSTICLNSQTKDLVIDARILSSSNMSKSGFFVKTMILSERYGRTVYRDPKLILIALYHLTFPVIMGLMMGPEPGAANACPRYRAQYNFSEFGSLNDNLTGGDVQEEFSLTMENLCNLFVTIYGVISLYLGLSTLSFTLDLNNAFREHANGWYPLSSYLTARLMTEIPLTIIMPILTVAVSYPMSQANYTSLNEYYRILIAAAALILGSMVSGVIGMTVGAIYIGHVSTAMFVSQAVLLPMVFISGFVKRTRRLSPIVNILSYTSIYRHMMEASMVARYGFNICKCNESLFTGESPKMVGMPDDLLRFTTNFIDFSETAESSSTERQDIFQLIAQQVSKYNTYGLQINSCSDVVPFQLNEFRIKESDLWRSYVSLSSILALTIVIFYVVVNWVGKRKCT